MRRVLWLVAGVTVVSAGAFVMGAAAAMTGAPVFSDARYPRAVAPAGDGYEASAGDPSAPQPGGSGSDGVRTGAEEPDGGGGHEPDATPLPRPGVEVPLTVTPAPATPPGSSPGRGGRPDKSAAPDVLAPEHGTGTAHPSPAEQEAWLAFQQLVRECMADEGQEYLYWEWWNHPSDHSNRFPAMPPDLAPDEHPAWELALNGTSPAGDDYRWQDAGCWGEAVHRTGGTH